jgi:hypothetical protein
VKYDIAAFLAFVAVLVLLNNIGALRALLGG